jgi:group I intron endonuclease
VLNFDCGIYTITSPSGKQYVGSAVSFKARWRVHRRHLRQGAHHCLSLQRAFNKYGEDALVFSKIAFCAKEDLIAREQEQIDARSRSKLYNSYMTAGSALGTKHGPEFGEKCRQRMLGSVQSEETKARRAESHKGQKRSAETRAKMSEAQRGIRTGRKLTDEHKANIATGNKGKKRSSAARAKMSAAQKGKRSGVPLSDETKRKMSASLKGKNAGKVRSQETREKLSKINKGKKLKAETKAKIGNYWLGRARSSNTSGYCGVTKASSPRRWKAQTTLDGKFKYLGTFDTPEAAYEAILKVRELEKLNPKESK